MKVFDKGEKTLEAVRKHYNCDGRQYRCRYYDDCVIDDDYEPNESMLDGDFSCETTE